MNENDLAEFVTLSQSKGNSENSWTVKVAELAEADLSVKNPNKKEEAASREPQEILEEMKTLDEETNDILNSIMEMI